MVDTVEIMPDIIFQDVALCPILSVMLSQKACQAIPGKVCTLSFTAGRVIVDQPVFKVWPQDVIAQAVLHHPVSERERFYLPFLRVIEKYLKTKSQFRPILSMLSYLSNTPYYRPISVYLRSWTE